MTDLKALLKEKAVIIIDLKRNLQPKMAHLKEKEGKKQ
jgi:hypothetical protein